MIKSRLIPEKLNKDISMLQEVGHRNNTVILIFPLNQCLHLMYFEVTWVLVSLGTQVQSQIILNSEYLQD